MTNKLKKLKAEHFIFGAKDLHSGYNQSYTYNLNSNFFLLFDTQENLKQACINSV